MNTEPTKIPDGSWIKDELIPATEAAETERAARPIVEETISEKDMHWFLSSGQVDESILKDIAKKYISGGIMTPFEHIIFKQKSTEVTDIADNIEPALAQVIPNEKDQSELQLKLNNFINNDSNALAGVPYADQTTIVSEGPTTKAELLGSTTASRTRDFAGFNTELPETAETSTLEINTSVDEPITEHAESTLSQENHDAELEKIQQAIASVQSGSETEVTLEISADSFAEYGEALRARLTASENTYGAEKETRKLEKELASFEKKESSVLQVRESLEFAKQKLEDSLISIDIKTKLEKQAAALERISAGLEKKRQSQDRDFKEKSLDWAKENVAERWRKGKWYHKVGIGIGLSTLTLGASQFVTRPLGLYASYQGIKQGKLLKLTNKIKELEASGKSEEAQMAEIEKVILENDFDRKALAGSIALSASFGALGEVLSQSGLTDTAVNYVAEKASSVVSLAEGMLSETVPTDTLISADPTSQIIGTAATGAIAEQVISSGQILEHAIVTVAPGTTMYSILEDEFGISDKLPEAGRQYNAIENILSQIKQNPTEFGITSGDIDKLGVGDKIDIKKISDIVSNYKIAGQGVFEHAQGLPAAVVSGIETYMPALAKAALSETANQKIEAMTAVASAPSPLLEVQPTPSGETTLLQLKEEGSLVDADPIDNNGQVESSTAHEQDAIDEAVVQTAPRVEVGLIPASFIMTELEGNRLGSLLISDITKLGGTWSDVTRFGTEPITSFIKNPPTGSEKALALIKSYVGETPVATNESGNVFQYLQRAALLKGRASNIV